MSFARKARQQSGYGGVSRHRAKQIARREARKERKRERKEERKANAPISVHQVSFFNMMRFGGNFKIRRGRKGRRDLERFKEDPFRDMSAFQIRMALVEDKGLQADTPASKELRSTAQRAYEETREAEEFFSWGRRGPKRRHRE